jgi:signal transduction histidine kinase
VLAGLEVEDWSSLLTAVARAQTWLTEAAPGVEQGPVLAKLAPLAGHRKWEVRRAIAQAAARTLHAAFEEPLARLGTDENGQVRQAAEHASLRRRDWANSSTLGKQHEDRLNTTLDDIEARFGVRGREAVKRASEEVANTFARQLYHEAIHLLSSLATSADRIRALAESGGAGKELVVEADRLGGRVSHLRGVLDAMRSYTHQPKLTFAEASLRELIDEVVRNVSDQRKSAQLAVPVITVSVDPSLRAEVDRGRAFQAFSNLVANAIESYDGLDGRGPIVINAVAQQSTAALTIQDAGRGMSEEALADSKVLFVTSKPTGTGFGLPLAIKIIESEHGGRLRLESASGVGTTVHVTLPLSQSRGEP